MHSSAYPKNVHQPWPLGSRTRRVACLSVVLWSAFSRGEGHIGRSTYLGRAPDVATLLLLLVGTTSVQRPQPYTHAASAAADVCGR